MRCSLSTKYDAVPNQPDKNHAFEGNIVDLDEISLDEVKAGQYAGQYTDRDLIDLSGMFGVHISLLNLPDDPWWEEAGCEPQYPYCEYNNGQEVSTDFYGTDDAIGSGLVTAEDLGQEEEWEDEEEDQEESDE